MGVNLQLDCGSKSLCGWFQAPAASVPLSGTTEWVVWAGSSTVRSPGGKSISGATSGSSGGTLTPCNGTQSTFRWAGGSSSEGICQTDGKEGMVFTVSPSPNKQSMLSVYAGATGATAFRITATLDDGGSTTVFSDQVNSTQIDISNKATTNLRWDLKFTAASPAAKLTVSVSSPSVPLPPSPSPTPAPCTAVLCGEVAEHNGDVSLSDVGTSDWTHYGLMDSIASVNRKCKAGALIGDLTPINSGGQERWFDNCPQTFSWTGGGSAPGTPTNAQVFSTEETPSAIYSSAAKGSAPGGFGFSVRIPAVTVTTRVYLYIGACSNQV